MLDAQASCPEHAPAEPLVPRTSYLVPRTSCLGGGMLDAQASCPEHAPAQPLVPRASYLVPRTSAALLVPQRLDRIEFRRFRGRIDPEQHADGGAEDEGADDG